MRAWNHRQSTCTFELADQYTMTFPSHFWGWVALGRFSEAKRCHRRAIRLATFPPDEACYNLGLILRAERKYAEALAALDHAIEIDPKYKVAKEVRADVLRAQKLKFNL